MKPTVVNVKWSEAGGKLSEGAILPFAGFETAALEAANGHRTGGYLKTAIIVHFDTGDTYECRIDLGAYEPLERGFEHGIGQRIHYHESAEGQRRLAETPGKMAANQRHLYSLWVQMDFAPDRTWCVWEVTDLSSPVDTTFCTQTTRH